MRSGDEADDDDDDDDDAKDDDEADEEWIAKKATERTTTSWSRAAVYRAVCLAALTPVQPLAAEDSFQQEDAL